MTMAVPTIISQLIILIYNMADTFFIGRTNDPFMVAGASLILPIFNVTIAVANIAGVGGGTLLARLLGAGIATALSNIFTLGFFCVVIARLHSPVLTLSQRVGMRRGDSSLPSSPSGFRPRRGRSSSTLTISSSTG